MVTGLELQQFEEENGLVHPPYYDLDDMAKEINQNGGKCPAGLDRRCPCVECIDEIEDEELDQNAACRKRYFVAPRYAEYWETAWNKYRRKQERQEKQRQQQPKEEEEYTPLDEAEEEILGKQYNVMNQKIANLISALEDAKQMILDGDYTTAHDRLIQEAMNQSCDLCVQYLESEAGMALGMGKLCEVDEAECEKEAEDATRRIDNIIQIYIEVDKSLVNNPNSGMPELDQIQQEEQPEEQPEPKKYKSPYYRCIATAMRQIDGKDQHEKMGIATILCKRRGKNGQAGQRNTEITDITK
jgi:hypothetical protein